MKNLLLTLMIITPFLITSYKAGGGCGCRATPYHVPYARVHKKPMATPSFAPVYSPIDIEVPVVQRCPSAHHHHGPRPRGRCRAHHGHRIGSSYSEDSEDSH